jgi:hypothetical protein
MTPRQMPFLPETVHAAKIEDEIKKKSTGTLSAVAFFHQS